MRSQPIQRLALAAAAALAVMCIPMLDAAAESADKAGNPAVSAPVGKAVLESHELIKQGKYDDALNKLASLSSLKNRTAQDDYLIERTRVAIASASNNEALLVTSLENVLASSESKGEERLQLIQALSDIHYRKKDFPKAAEWLSRYFSEGGTDSALRTRLARAYYFQNDFAGAAREARKVVDTEEAKGAVPSQDGLTICLASSQRLKDDTTVRYALEKLAQYYPNYLKK